MKTKLILKDEVNCKFEGLGLTTRRKLEKKLKFFLPHAYHVPAYKLGRWDGCVGYFTMGGNTFVNCLPTILPILDEEGYGIEIEDHRQPHDLKWDTVTEQLFSDRQWPDKHPAAGEPVVLRDYQVEVINKFLKTPQCLQEIATGAGKTLITAALSYMCEAYGRSIVIVPNKDLVTQTEADYINLGLDVCLLYTSPSPRD